MSQFQLNRVVGSPPPNGLPNLEYNRFQHPALAQTIAIMLANEAGRLSATNEVRTLAFNILSTNNWGNEDVFNLVSALVHGALSSGAYNNQQFLLTEVANALFSFCYSLYTRFPDLARMVSPNTNAGFDRWAKDNFMSQQQPMHGNWQTTGNNQMQWHQQNSGFNNQRYYNQTPKAKSDRYSYLDEGSNNQPTLVQEAPVEQEQHRTSYNHNVIGQNETKEVKNYSDEKVTQVPRVDIVVKTLKIDDDEEETTPTHFNCFKDLVHYAKSTNAKEYLDKMNDQSHEIKGFYVEGWIAYATIGYKNMVCDFIEKMRELCELKKERSFDYNERYKNMFEVIRKDCTQAFYQSIKLEFEVLGLRNLAMTDVNSDIDSITALVENRKERPDVMDRIIKRYLQWFNSYITVDADDMLIHKENEQKGVVDKEELIHYYYKKSRVIVLAMNSSEFEVAVGKFKPGYAWLDFLQDWVSLYFVTEDGMVYHSESKESPICRTASMYF